MPSPLEYLLLMMMSGPDAAADAAHGLNRINPATGDATIRESILMEDSGTMTMKTILMEPPGTETAKTLEAPVRITPDLVPSFKINQPVILTIDETGSRHVGRVARIESITDESGQIIQVILELSAMPESLQPGMTATARMQTIIQ
jgi:hypothetical protein